MKRHLQPARRPIIRSAGCKHRDFCRMRWDRLACETRYRRLRDAAQTADERAAYEKMLRAVRASLRAIDHTMRLRGFHQMAGTRPSRGL